MQFDLAFGGSHPNNGVHVRLKLQYLQEVELSSTEPEARRSDGRNDRRSLGGCSGSLGIDEFPRSAIPAPADDCAIRGLTAAALFGGWARPLPPLWNCGAQATTWGHTLTFIVIFCMNYCMVARLGGQSGSAVLFPSAGGAGLGTLASLDGDGMLGFLVEFFFCHSIFTDKEFGAQALRRRFVAPLLVLTEEQTNQLHEGLRRRQAIHLGHAGRHHGSAGLQLQDFLLQLPMALLGCTAVATILGRALSTSPISLG